jgi:hypothetical protein
MLTKPKLMITIVIMFITLWLNRISTLIIIIKKIIIDISININIIIIIINERIW